jgi:ABC-type Zn uptake system ZnuABC Zn-binding protein ZnuA
MTRTADHHRGWPTDRFSLAKNLLTFLCISAGLAPSVLARSPISVAVTLSDTAPIARAVGGSEVAVFSVMPPGSDPHSVSLSVEIIQRLKSAELVVFAHSQSLSFEEKLKQNLGGQSMLDWPDYQSRGARLSDFIGMRGNPHGYWLGFENASAIARALTEALIALGGDERIIRSNSRLFIDEIEALRKAGLDASKEAGYGGDTVIAVVPGVAYVLQNTGLRIGGILLADEGSGQVEAGRLREISTTLSNGGARALVCPIGLKNGKAGEIAEQLARDTDSRAIYVQFLATGDTSRTFLSQAAFNGMLLAHGLAHVSIEQPADNGSSAFYAILMGVMALVFLALIFLACRRVLAR